MPNVSHSQIITSQDTILPKIKKLITSVEWKKMMIPEVITALQNSLTTGTYPRKRYTCKGDGTKKHTIEKNRQQTENLSVGKSANTDKHTVVCEYRPEYRSTCNNMGKLKLTSNQKKLK